jgi:hypothetical protein
MITTLTTYRDALDLIRRQTECYVEAPTAEQEERAARALVRHLGGFGFHPLEVTEELWDTFDLDAALFGADWEDQ